MNTYIYVVLTFFIASSYVRAEDSGLSALFSGKTLNVINKAKEGLNVGDQLFREDLKRPGSIPKLDSKKQKKAYKAHSPTRIKAVRIKLRR